jgi:hypothetical protein
VYKIVPRANERASSCFTTVGLTTATTNDGGGGGDKGSIRKKKKKPTSEISGDINFPKPNLSDHAAFPGVTKTNKPLPDCPMLPSL